MVNSIERYLVEKRKIRNIGIYPRSVHYAKNCVMFMIADDNFEVYLIAAGDGEVLKNFEGEEHVLPDCSFKFCRTSKKNLESLAGFFPFIKPTSHRGSKITLGLGDRLGLASAAHVRLLDEYDVFPVLAQQSIRELNLTGRTYEDVLAAASWDVFREGWTRGFGADGDHLKTEGEVKMALDCGYTMITLDCSEHIDNSISALDADEVHIKYADLPGDKRERLEKAYLGKNFDLSDGVTISFSREEFERSVLVYHKAIKFTVDLFSELIKDCGRVIDFEMSIDETHTPTAPQEHFFVASELIKGGVDMVSLAPRFCGEFQKGIDYRGDLLQFEKEYIIHVKIASYFGYKLSIHSGSDKFSVFPIIGKQSGGKYHLKTAGTNWLEAVRVIAARAPGLFRRMYNYSLENFDAAKKYYHISTTEAEVPDIEKAEDSDLPLLLDDEAARQLLHITYGVLLCAKSGEGAYLFRDEFYEALKKYEGDYIAALNKHIGRHLSGLCINKKLTENL